MNYYAATAFFNGLFGLFVVYYVFLRNPKNLLNQTFSLFGLAVAGWSLAYALWCWSNSYEEALRLCRTHMLFCSLIPAAFFHFVAVLTNKNQPLRYWIKGNYVISGVNALLFQTPFMISGLKEVLSFKYWPAPGMLLPLFVAYFSGLILYCFYLMIRYACTLTGSERRQIIVMVSGFILGFGGGWTNWFLWFDIEIVPFANFFVGLLFATMLYVIVRYGVMDQDVLVELVRNNRLRHMGLLMASINHEIKNPLYVIRGLADARLSENVSSPDDLKETCFKTRQQVDRITSVIERFSSLVKTPPNARLDQETADLSEVLKNVESLVMTQFRVDKIEFQKKIHENLPPIEISEVHLEEVLVNLVLNAAEAVKERMALLGSNVHKFEGKIFLEASITSNNVEIYVEDNGVGIKDLKNLFKILSTSKSNGTGLGLYITKQIVEHYKGKISARSKPDGGAAFTVKLKTKSFVNA